MSEPLIESKNEIDEGIEYDLVLVFKAGDKDKKVTIEKKKGEDVEEVEITEFQLFHERWSTFFGKLEHSKLKFLLYKSEDKKYFFCLLTADVERFKDEAERVEYDLEFDPEELIAAGREHGLLLVDYVEDKGCKYINKEQFNYIYGPFIRNDDDNEREKIYRKHGDEKNLFRKIDRIKLLYMILEAERKLGGCGLELSVLIKDSQYPLVACFPFHEKEKLLKLKAKMNSVFTLKNPPLREIRDYFGEQVALYFAFLSFYTWALLIPSGFGVVTFIVTISTNLTANAMLPIFGIIICLWATMFLEYWKRYQSILRGQWGMAEFLRKEQPRPNFKGDWKPSAIDGRQEEYYPLKKKYPKLAASAFIVFALIILVTAAVIGILLLKTNLQDSWSKNDASYFTSFLAAINIQFWNFVYSKIVLWLNDWENHKTDTEYENAKIIKIFLFKFINSYNSLFYTAFYIHYNKEEGCGAQDPDCLNTLRTLLGTIFITQIVINNLLEFMIPEINKRWARSKHESLSEATTAEKDFFLKGIYESTLSDFDEISIQYGYASLFVMAFPLTPLFALLNNLIENKLDSYKLCNDFRRPEPRGVYNIGAWYAVFESIGFFAVIINVALLVFMKGEDTYLKNESKTVEFTIFLFVEHFLFLVKGGIAYVVSDEPIEETFRLKRQRYLVNVLLRGAKYEDSEDDEDTPTKKKNAMKEGRIEKWLERIGLQQYASQFKENDYNDMRKIKKFNDEQINIMLKKVGIEEEADKKTLRQKIAERKNKRMNRKQNLMEKYKIEKIGNGLPGDGFNFYQSDKKES